MVDVDIDPHRPRRVLAVAVFCLCLTWVAVPLRIYSRLFLTRVFTLDDKLICLVQITFTAYLLTDIAAVLHGSGHDAVEISPEDRRIALQLFFVGELLYLITTILLKVCVGLLLLSIAIVPLHIWTLRILLCSTFLFGSLYFILVIFQYRPLHVFWDVGPRTPGSCFSTSVVLGCTYTLAILNCIADWTFGILPLLIVWSLQMRLKTKLLVILLLGFASIASIATIVRAVAVPGLLSQENFFRDTAYLTIWSNIEPGIGIAAACAPALSPLVRHILGKRQRRGYESGIWRTRELPTITDNSTMALPERTERRQHEFRNSSKNDILRLRFDDFSYESRITSGPQAHQMRPVPPPPRSRASWAFPIRRGSAVGGGGFDCITADTTLTTSTISSDGAAAEPPSSGIMKTMEFQLSYEARTWTTSRQGRMIPRDESMTLRPSTIAEMRRVTSGEVPLLHEGLSPTSPEYDIEAGFTGWSRNRHSSPPASPWEWMGTGQARPLSMNGGKFAAEATHMTTAEKRLSTKA
ncbi:hypothetical protein BDP81DRAFT_394064 [Colletotrichum phormii]|uniref:Rhodopsin domain-containing protein n=1 Tax=Colletotrichum phormii TaxID=359342 RepID=A0AAI9ZVI7_9PEZI|nr:uncharacterized protein BDP81DRAFT_394064 [Colletotrichum phormii]KAK1637397.1 hypothetical protein BDP81DRAFT_394064 [Colletotrichum phormii]